MKLLVFGEVLWDVFPQRKEIGGTALNFSAHAAKLGAETALVTAVGNDSLAQETLNVIRGHNIDDRYITTADVPTGTCQVTITDGHPTYDLVRNISYDYILADNAIADAASGLYDVLYIGTLAQRGEVSRKNVRRLISEGSFREVFCDLNIRQTYYNRDIVETCLNACSILKVSREEFHVFKELNIARSIYPAESEAAYLDICNSLCRQFGIKIILLTLDKDGALLYTNIGHVYHSPVPKSKVVSTVGAGDSFSACFIVNYLNGVSLDKCVDRAVLLSDYIVTQLGAVPEYAPGLLEQLTK